VLDSLGDRERAALLRVAVRRRFRSGEVVFHEGDPGDALHIVVGGVFIVRSAGTLGEMIGVNTIGPGNVFGEGVLVNPGARRSATVVALHGGTTLMVARRDFEALRDREPKVDRFLVSVLAERNRVLTEQLVELQYTPVEQRVHRRLLAFADAIDDADSDGWVALNQAELAILAGTTRSTANRVLRRAERRGIVELGRGRIRVVDRDALAART
jgi:CRP/FNR family transcriptional regulator, cyclic AMP receptor protein